jgi:hypothetical protein
MDRYNNVAIHRIAYLNVTNKAFFILLFKSILECAVYGGAERGTGPRRQNKISQRKAS